MDEPSQSALLRTLAFFALFGRVLKTGELRELAWGKIDSFEAELDALVAGGQIQRRDEYVQITGEKDIEEGIALMSERAVLAAPLLARAQRFAALAARLPFVRGVFLVNSLALGTNSAASDIDLLIIASPGHIWSVRAATTMLAQVLGWRRHGKRVARRLCLSFYLAEDALDLSAMRLPDADPYLLFWCATIRHLAGPVDRARFLHANPWVGEALPQLPRLPAPETAPAPPAGRIIFEPLLRRIQLPRMQRAAAALPDAGGSAHTDSMLKFHDRDRREEFRAEWRERCRAAGMEVY